MLENFRNLPTRILIVAILVFLSIWYYKTNNSNAPKKTSLNTDFAIQNKQEFEDLIKNYIISNPEVLIQSLEEMQKKRLQAQESQIESAIQKNQKLLEGSKAIVIGNPTGTVTIIEFFDYNCGYCKKASSVINSIIAKDNNIKVIYKPVAFFGENSEYAAKVAMAVYKLYPSKFSEINSGIFSLSEINKESIQLLLQNNEIDINTINSEITGTEINASFDNVKSIASEIRLNAVPLFIINGKYYGGYLDETKMLEAIEKAKKALVLNPEHQPQDQGPKTPSDDNGTDKQIDNELKTINPDNLNPSN